MTDEGAIRVDERLNANLHWIFPVLLGFMALGPLIFAYQGLQWLRTGAWEMLPVSEVFGTPPRTSWSGLQRLLDWFASVEVGWVILLAAFMTLMWALNWMDRIGDHARIARLNKADAERDARAAKEMGE